MALKSIFKYSDYRSYLRDFYNEKKKGNAKYSYRVFAATAGLGSPNYLKLVIDGTRNLTIANIHQFAKALHLGRDEQALFEGLVLFNQSTTAEETRFYNKRLDHLKTLQTGQQVRLTNEREILAHQLFPAILLALIGLQPEDAVSRVSKRLGLDKTFLEQAIAFLQREQLVAAMPTGFVVNAGHYIFHDPLPNRLQKQFLRRQLNLSVRAFERAYGDSAKFFSHTFTLPKAALVDCVEDIKNLVSSVNKTYDDLAPETLAQLNIQLFRLDSRVL